MSIQENLTPIDVPNRKWQMGLLIENLNVLRRMYEQYEVAASDVRKETLLTQIRNVEGYVKQFEFTDS